MSGRGRQGASLSVTSAGAPDYSDLKPSPRPAQPAPVESYQPPATPEADAAWDAWRAARRAEAAAEAVKQEAELAALRARTNLTPEQIADPPEVPTDALAVIDAWLAATTARWELLKEDSAFL